MFFTFGIILTLGIFYITETLQTKDTAPEKSSAAEGYDISQIVTGSLTSELGVNRNGNVYAPEVIYENGVYKMWYGGQGEDWHDRIHYTESADGVTWSKKGVVLDNGTSNHVNDPSVVKVNGVYYMYYTEAIQSIVDQISLAVSDDGINWVKKGAILSKGNVGQWDSCFVGRPSVIYENGQFKMWYDGRKDWINGDLSAYGCPRNQGSKRSVGYAFSTDGYNWTKYTGNPVYGNDAGAVDVERVANIYTMVYESRDGIILATSLDGNSWIDRGFLLQKGTAAYMKFGFVTPSISMANNTYVFYAGAAAANTWDNNSIVLLKLSNKSFQEFVRQLYTCRIQGIVYNQKGEQCTSQNCGTYSMILDNNTNSDQNPYFFYDVSYGEHTITLQNAQSAESSLCIECTNHPEGSYIPGKTRSITCLGESYIDLHWRIEKQVVQTISIEQASIPSTTGGSTQQSTTKGWGCEDVDTNADNKISVVELSLLAKFYGESCIEYCSNFDTNADNIINDLDLDNIKGCL